MLNSYNGIHNDHIPSISPRIFTPMGGTAPQVLFTAFYFVELTLRLIAYGVFGPQFQAVEGARQVTPKPTRDGLVSITVVLTLGFPCG